MVRRLEDREYLSALTLYASRNNMLPTCRTHIADLARARRRPQTHHFLHAAIPNQPGSVMTFGGYDLDLVRRNARRTTGSNGARVSTWLRTRDSKSLRGGTMHPSTEARGQGAEAGSGTRSAASLGGGDHDDDDAKGRRERTRRASPGDHRQAPNDVEGDDPVIVWAPVTTYHGLLSYWSVQLSGWWTEHKALGDGDANPMRQRNGGNSSGGAGPNMCVEGCQAIVDTGSSLLLVPKGIFDAVVGDIIGGRKDCRVKDNLISCSRCDANDFPDVVISISSSSRSVDGPPSTPSESARHTPSFSQEFRLQPSDYLSQRWGGCDLQIGSGLAEDMWTLGDVFIKTYMTIFDAARLRIGFVCPDGGRCHGGVGPSLSSPRQLCLPAYRPTTTKVGFEGRSNTVPAIICVPYHILFAFVFFVVGFALASGTGSYLARSRVTQRTSTDRVGGTLSLLVDSILSQATMAGEQSFVSPAGASTQVQQIRQGPRRRELEPQEGFEKRYEHA